MKDFLTWEGSMGRMEYLGYVAIQFVMMAAVIVIVGAVPEDGAIPTPYLAAVIGMLLSALWLGIVSSLRRLSDMGWSRLLILLKCIPLVGIPFELFLLFKGPKEETATV